MFFSLFGEDWNDKSPSKKYSQHAIVPDLLIITSVVFTFRLHRYLAASVWSSYGENIASSYIPGIILCGSIILGDVFVIVVICQVEIK